MTRSCSVLSLQKRPKNWLNSLIEFLVFTGMKRRFFSNLKTLVPAVRGPTIVVSMYIWSEKATKVRRVAVLFFQIHFILLYCSPKDSALQMDYNVQN